jgi:plastocyanin
MKGGACVAFIVFALTAAFVSPVEAAVIRIAISNVAFPPKKVTARVGDTVEWTNKDFVAHTATARDGTWDVNLPPGKSGSTVMKKAGKIQYYCRYHPTMKGEIDVSPR